MQIVILWYIGLFDLPIYSVRIQYAQNTHKPTSKFVCTMLTDRRMTIQDLRMRRLMHLSPCQSRNSRSILVALFYAHSQCHNHVASKACGSPHAACWVLPRPVDRPRCGRLRGTPLFYFVPQMNTVTFRDGNTDRKKPSHHHTIIEWLRILLCRVKTNGIPWMESTACLQGGGVGIKPICLFYTLRR